jgi:hypothetical protein
MTLNLLLLKRVKLLEQVGREVGKCDHLHRFRIGLPDFVSFVYK